MLVVRLQRTGRKGHAMFRVVVQDSRRTPTSGKVVAWLGSYDPHSKKVSVDLEKAKQFIYNGAQPSDKVVYILEKEGVKMPAWVTKPAEKKRSVKNPEKRRSTAPKEEKVEEEEVAEAPKEEASNEEAKEEPAEASAEEKPAEEEAKSE